MLCSLTTWAAKAESIPVQVRQADGSVITVILRGDEHINWYTTLDGVLLVQGADNNYYIGKVEKSGNLIATKQLAHEALTRSQAERNLIAKQDKEKFFAYVNKIAEESEKRLRQLSSYTRSNHRFWLRCVLISLTQVVQRPLSSLQSSKTYHLLSKIQKEYSQTI